jgi:hypothetical protein
MGQIAMVLPPPSLWQQFEELTTDVVRYIYNDKAATRYGNQGAPQHGVDVYGRENPGGRRIAVQCKRLGKIDAQGRMLPGGLQPKDLVTEIAKAKSFPGGFDHYILATTDLRQVAIQDEERRVSEAESFTFQVWFWDDYLGYLHRYAPLLNWYYEHVLELKGVYNADHQILYLLHMAFSRPAFTTRLSGEESGSGLFQALQDTETAINLGQLKDRKTKGLLRVAPGGVGMLSNPLWQTEIAAVLKKVQTARRAYKQGVEDEKIIEYPKRVGVADWQVGQNIDTLRGDAIRILNGVLRNAGLPEVVSPL